MLYSIIEAVYFGNTYSVEKLAVQLELDADALHVQMEHLVRCGYLQRVSPAGRQNRCKGCSGCYAPPKASFAMWELTEKGRVIVVG